MANYSKNKKYHFTYKTTNLINGRYYLGMHSTNRLDDGYLGSGTRLYRELNKYGRDNFKLEILDYFNTRDELVEAEKTLITEEDLNSKNCLNLKPGGNGGLVSKEHLDKLKAGASKYQKERWKDKKYKEYISKLTSNYNRERSKNKEWVKRITKKLTFEGKTHSEESKHKIGIANSKHQKGSNNSQYGTCWITDGEHSKKIKKGDSIPNGWSLGRVLKKS